MIDNKTLLDKVKRILPEIIYHNNQFSNTKREYYRMASSIDPILAPEVAPGDMSSRVQYLKEIFYNFNTEQVLTLFPVPR